MAIGAMIAGIDLHIVRHVPKVLGILGLAAATCGINNAIVGSGKNASCKRRRTKPSCLGLLMGMMLGIV